MPPALKNYRLACPESAAGCAWRTYAVRGLPPADGGEASWWNLPRTMPRDKCLHRASSDTRFHLRRAHSISDFSGTPWAYKMIHPFTARRSHTPVPANLLDGRAPAADQRYAASSPRVEDSSSRSRLPVVLGEAKAGSEPEDDDLRGRPPGSDSHSDQRGDMHEGSGESAGAAARGQEEGQEEVVSGSDQGVDAQSVWASRLRARKRARASGESGLAVAAEAPAWARFLGLLRVEGGGDGDLEDGPERDLSVFLFVVANWVSLDCGDNAATWARLAQQMADRLDPGSKDERAAALLESFADELVPCADRTFKDVFTSLAEEARDFSFLLRMTYANSDEREGQRLLRLRGWPPAFSDQFARRHNFARMSQSLTDVLRGALSDYFCAQAHRRQLC